MCIIAYKPEGIALPTKKQLKTCWENNPDGAGFMFVQDDIADCHKGFMSFNEFWRAYRAYKLTKDDTIVWHFRIGTSGKNDATATHPFPITDNIQKLRALDYTSKTVFMHNGILGQGDNKRRLSDTQLFSLEFLYNLKEFLDDNKVLAAIEYASVGSRLLIFNHGEIITTGNWIKDKSGMFFSNDHYKPFVPINRKTKKNRYAWEDIDWIDDKYNAVDDIYCPICSCVSYDGYSNQGEYEYICNDCLNIFTEQDVRDFQEPVNV